MEICQYLSTDKYHNANFRNLCYGDIITTKIIDIFMPIMEPY